MQSFCNNLFLVSINLWLWVLYSVSSIVIICMRRKKTPIYSSHDNGRNQVEFPKNAPAWKSGISCSLHLLYISNSDLYFEIPIRKWPDSVELVSKEVNHLAAILHVYAGDFSFKKSKKKLLLFFKKKMEILLHF